MVAGNAVWPLSGHAGILYLQPNQARLGAAPGVDGGGLVLRDVLLGGLVGCDMTNAELKAADMSGGHARDDRNRKRYAEQLLHVPRILSCVLGACWVTRLVAACNDVLATEADARTSSNATQETQVLDAPDASGA